MMPNSAGPNFGNAAMNIQPMSGQIITGGMPYTAEMNQNATASRNLISSNEYWSSFYFSIPS